MAALTPANPNQLDLVLPATPIYLGIALVLVLVLWPARSSANRLLRRLDVKEPTGPEIDDALRYLRHRVVSYPVFYLVVSAADLFLLPGQLPLVAFVVAVMLTGGLLAEALAWHGNRAVAPPDAPRARYTLRALVPWPALVLAALQLGTLAVFSGAALAGQGWAVGMIPRPAPVLTCVAAGTLLSAASVWLAARRPASRCVRVDEACRARTARVSVALAMLAINGVGAGDPSPVVSLMAWLGLVGAIATTAHARRGVAAAVTPSSATPSSGRTGVGPRDE